MSLHFSLYFASRGGASLGGQKHPAIRDGQAIAVGAAVRARCRASTSAQPISSPCDLEGLILNRPSASQKYQPFPTLLSLVLIRPVLRESNQREEDSCTTRTGDWL